MINLKNILIAYRKKMQDDEVYKHENGKARPFMSSNIQWQNFKVTEAL